VRHIQKFKFSESYSIVALDASSRTTVCALTTVVSQSNKTKSVMPISLVVPGTLDLPKWSKIPDLEPFEKHPKHQNEVLDKTSLPMDDNSDASAVRFGQYLSI
jgi:hypothetical protein